MDAVMKRLEQLAELASRRADPAPLDAGGVMLRIRNLDIDDAADIVPIRLFAGGALVAAAAAAFMSVLGVSAWNEIANPTLVPIDSLISLSNALDLML